MTKHPYQTMMGADIFGKADQLIDAAVRVLIKNEERVEVENGQFIINGILQTPDQVIEYADEIYRIEKFKPLHPRAELYGRPKVAGN